MNRDDYDLYRSQSMFSQVPKNDTRFSVIEYVLILFFLFLITAVCVSGCLEAIPA